MDRGACQAKVHGVAKSWTQLSTMHACTWPTTILSTASFQLYCFRKHSCLSLGLISWHITLMVYQGKTKLSTFYRSSNSRVLSTKWHSMRSWIILTIVGEIDHNYWQSQNKYQLTHIYKHTHKPTKFWQHRNFSQCLHYCPDQD